MQFFLQETELQGLENAKTFQIDFALFGNFMPSVPVGQKWLICADLKIVGPLNGLQTEYTKFCKWDNRVKSEHYVHSKWSPRKL